MSKWLIWLLLARVTGSPIGSLVLLLLIWWGLDRATTRILPDPLQGILRWRRAGRLKATLANNPNDRRARYELADICVQQRRYQAAFDLLKPNYEAGDHDVPTLFLLGVAAKGSGQLDQAARILQAVNEDDPDYRLGAAALELAQIAGQRGDHAKVVAILEPFLERRRSSVRARVMMADAKLKLGDPAAAQSLKDAAWHEYVGMPGYQRRSERLWAWRAKPARPIMYGAAALAFALVMATYVAPAISDATATPPPVVEDYEEP
ncbi:MAG: tetratricopeptide repeat protein [Deltaproteobacteria bacterium]|nr:tetratricopeptide repeat protein [Deltaproteobacteria bacterium]